MDRRGFIKTVALSAGVLPQIMPGVAFGQDTDFWSQPRTLWLRRNEVHEEVKATYFADGRIIKPEYHRLCVILRDTQANKAVEMSLVLLDALAGIQGILRAYGIDDPLDTNSGYRTIHTNNHTEGAVKNSRHTKAQAWDGNVRRVTTKSLAECATYLKAGGVGLYMQKDFLHIDSGNIRAWRAK